MQMLFWRKNHRVGSLRRETKSKNSTQKRNLKAKEHAPEGQTLKIYRVVPKNICAISWDYPFNNKHCFWHFFWFCYMDFWGDIFRVQTHRGSQTIVFRYREIGCRRCTKCWQVLFLSYHLLGRNHTIFFTMFRIPPYSLKRNTIVGETWPVCTLKMSPLGNFWFYLLSINFSESLCEKSFVFLVFFRFFGLFQNRSDCFGCFKTVPKHRNKPKKIVFGFAKQTENQPKQTEFWFVSVRTDIFYFVSRTP
jgi:hypothetical protein